MNALPLCRCASLWITRRAWTSAVMGTMISGTRGSGGCDIGATSLISGTGGGGGCDTGVIFL